MRTSDIEIRYYETYYFANVVQNILTDQFAYLRTLEDFYGDEKQCAHSVAFPRFSALHSFIEFIAHDLICDLDSIDLASSLTA